MISRLLRFGLLGGLSFVLNLAITAGLHELAGAPEEVAFAVALVVVFAVNFVSCRYVVFAGREGDLGRQLTAYAVSSFSFRGAEYLSFLLLHTWLGTPYLVAVTAVLLTWFLIKFTVYGRWVFTPSR